MKKIYFLFLLFAIGCSTASKKEITQKKTDKPANITTTPENQVAFMPKSDRSTSQEQQFYEVGYSSWYGDQFQNKPTASGEMFDKFKLTAAHRTLPMGSEVKVLNMENQKETIVRINDRGPFNKTRIIDVSEKAAEVLDFKEAGITRVGLTLVNKEEILPVKDDDAFFIDDEEDDEDEIDDEDIVPITPPKKDSKSTPPAKTDKKTPPAVNPNPTPNTNTTNPPVQDVTKLVEGQPKGYTVQIGVFKDKKRAENFKNEIKSGFSEPVFIFNRNGTYVTQIGDFNNRNDAITLRTKLKSKNIFGFIPPK